MNSQEDIVRVVRCKDCEHYFSDKELCMKHSDIWGMDDDVYFCTKPNDYCSYGKRRNDYVIRIRNNISEILSNIENGEMFIEDLGYGNLTRLKALLEDKG